METDSPETGEGHALPDFTRRVAARVADGLKGDMKKTAQQTPESPVSLQSIGRQLSATREKWGLSVKEAAQYLNLSTSIIEALEEGAYERLPGTTYIMGYIRAYAKLLKLDYDEILASIRLAEQSYDIPVARISPRSVAYETGPKKSGGSVLRWLLIAGVLAALLGIAVSQLTDLNIDSFLNTSDSGEKASAESAVEKHDSPIKVE